MKKTSPLESVRLTISQMEQELSELRSRQGELEVLERQRKASKKVETETNPEMERYLKESQSKKFSEHIEFALKMLRNGSQPNWKHMAPMYQFSNEKELKRWFFEKMNSDGVVV